MTPPRRLAPTLAVLVVAALGFTACIIADWPGHFPPDAIDQLAQGRSGVFNFWHPPVMAWLLGLADRVLAGAPLFFVVDAGLFFAALAAMVLVRGTGWWAVAVTAAISASPLALIYQGLVVKDVLFADASLAGFAALAWTARLWPRRPARLALCALALALLTLAALARQNGLIVAVSGALTLAWIDLAKARHTTAPRAALRFAVVAVAGLASMGLVGGLAELEFRAHSDHEPEAARQWMSLQIYDLAGALRREPGLALPVLRRADPATESFVRREAAPKFDPTRIDPMYLLGHWNVVLKRPTPWVGAQWRQLISTAPGLYLAVRGEAFRQVFLTPDIRACAAVLVGVDPGHPTMLRRAGLAARETDKDDWDGDYAAAFLGTPVFSHAAYAVLALAMLVLTARDLVRRQAVEMIATVGMLVAVLAFTASFFVISLACDYRYLYFLDVAAMAALAQRAALWRKPSG